MFMSFVCSVLFTKAAIIVIDDDEEPDGTNVYTLSANEYYIYFDELLEEGNVYCTRNGQTRFVGTCSIVLVNDNIVERICVGNENSIGEIKIYVNGDYGFIFDAICEISEIFVIGTKVSIIN